MQTGLRSYRAEDFPVLIDLFRMNTPAYFSPVEEKDLIHYLHHKKELYYVMELNGQVIGCGGINFKEDGKMAVLSWDFFHPQYRGKGLGTQLVKYRLDKIREYKNITSVTVRTSQYAFRFYEKQGFTLKEIVKDFWAPGFDLYDCSMMIR